MEKDYSLDSKTSHPTPKGCGFSRINKTLIFLMIITFGSIIWIDRYLVFNNLISTGHSTIGLWYGDFGGLYSATSHYINTGKIYGFSQIAYAYPPLSIIVFSPFAFLNQDTALIAKIIIDIICYGITIFFILKILKKYNVKLSKVQSSALFLSMLLFYPVSVSFAAGTISAQVLILTTISYYYLFIKKNTTISSLSICLASIIKIIPFDLILLNKQLRIKTSLLFLSSFVVSILLMGLKTHIDWIKYLAVTQRIDLVGEGITTVIVRNPIHSYEANTSISLTIYKFIGFIGQPISINTIAIILAILKITVIIYFIWFIHKTYKCNYSKETDILYFSLLIILPLILSNTTWIYYWVFMITPIILWLFVLNLTKYDKMLLFVSLILMTTQSPICYIADTIGGTIKSLIYIIPPITLSSILTLVFILNKIKTTTSKSNYYENKICQK